MSERIHALAYHLFGKSSIDDCDIREIQAMTERYPYFAPARFLLLEKLKRENAPEYSDQLQKAVLYYHNPLEFEQFISSDRFYTDVTLDKEAASESQVAPVVTKEVEEHEPIAFYEEAKPEFTEAEVKDEDVAIAEDILIQETEEQEEGSGRNFEEENPVPAALERSEEFRARDPRLEDLHFELPRNNTDLTHDPAETDTESLSVDAGEYNEPAPKMATGEDYPVELKDHSVPGDTEVHHSSIGQPSAIQSGTQSLTFEPFHTVDYFASQGIRLSQEEAGKDKFGKQLKSFTEWLKTMKKLPSAQPRHALDGATDQKVVHLAEDSVHDADIVTEAMAEVWIKQGKPEKALEVYKKLSLLNPSKRDYFAGKIDHLKLS